MSEADLSAQFELQPGWQYAPNLEEVAALLRARLYVDGQQHLTFNDQTRPDAAQAAALVTTAASYVRAQVGEDIPEPLWATASHVTSLRAAMLIEMSYWPEQATEQGSTYQVFKELFDQSLVGLLDALGEQGTDARAASIPMGNSVLSAWACTDLGRGLHGGGA